MTPLRPINPAAISTAPLPPRDCGQIPQLRHIEIEKLRVDPTYQREIMDKGRRNIMRIAVEFDWAQFSPVIVAPHKDLFVIIDGQHRTTAAAMRGHKKVPCQIVSADQRKQAAAFAAINANVTAMSSMQVHAARVAAGDPDALRLAKVCASAGVTLLRYSVQVKNQKVGETMAVAQIRQALEKFGEKILALALSAITKTRDGNPGMIRGYLVLALCVVLEGEPEWQNQKALLATFERFDFPANWVAAATAKEATTLSRAGFVSTLVDLLAAFLDKSFAKAA
jgi:hypothetical protein